MLSVSNSKFEFASLLVIMPDSHASRVRAHVLLKRERVQYPLLLLPLNQLEYFHQVPRFQPLSLLKKPMAIVLIMTLLMAFGMPKLISAMGKFALSTLVLNVF